MKIYDQLKELSCEVKLVLFVQWLTAVGYFSVIPFLVVYLVNTLALSTQFATFQLSLFLAGQYGATFIGGLLTDKKSAQFTMKFGLALQISCYLLFMHIGSDTLLICILSTLIGISKGLFTPAAKALVAKVSDGDNGVLLFSFRSTINNIGVAVGSTIGGLLIGIGSGNFFLSAALSQAFAFVVLLKVEKPLELHLSTNSIKNLNVSVKSSLICIFKTPAIWVLSLLYALFSFLYMQLESSFPLFASNYWGTSAVTFLFITNAIVVILLQVYLNVWMNERFSHWMTMAIGFTSLTICFIGLGLNTELWMFIVFVSIYTVGEITIDPTIDSVVALQVRDEFLGTAYGVLGIAGLLGGVTGNIASGHFLSSMTGAPETLWSICTLVALLSVFFSIIIWSLKNKRKYFLLEIVNKR
ncbi:MFS transporter [Vibrio sp. AND4]|uniref:MFS transporter n=1 Tax=Vibrio sp. AND4 TaxID=314289 RepID=UPI00015F27CB|nr:MFS transporter [Vibrio sp. AND4]EDP57386.1 putative transport system membrane protein [Vibrio sp. AND4]